jgi:hypothetical protein
MKQISSEEASTYLRRVGLTVGNWKQIRPIDAQSQGTWRVSQAPANAQELFVFSLHVAGWLPKAQWKVLQFDYSNLLRPYEAALISRLVLGQYDALVQFKSQAFLFEFGRSPEVDFAEEVAIASIIHAVLLLQGHGYIATSNQDCRDYLGIQDGFVYFLTDQARIGDVDAFLANMQSEPPTLPLWATWTPE